MRIIRMSFLAAFPACFLFATTLAMANADSVTLREDGRRFHFDNGLISASIDKDTGRVISIRKDNQEMLAGGGGYWSLSAGSGRHRIGGFGASGQGRMVIDPAGTGGKRAEVAVDLHGTGYDGAWPGDVELRYAMESNRSVLYVSAILRHGPGDARIRVGEGRFVAKLNPRHFTRLTIDEDRDLVMPSGPEWDAGEEMNLKEVRRITIGPRAGHIEHKYAYSAMMGEARTYGWSGQRHGCWLINPSIEYIAGGPTKMELTAHLDVGPGGLPVILNMWQGSHYGGAELSLAEGEPWTRVIGPFLLYFNEGDAHEERWRDARETVDRESTAWPYEWFVSEAYPPEAARGTLTGSLNLVAGDGTAAPPSAGFHIGLTASDDELPLPRENLWPTPTWQRDGIHYQYWAKVGPNGTFAISHVRPGKYTLRAFGDGVPGEFAKAGIEVKAGKTTDAGGLAWDISRPGPVLWEIGIPDRGAREFWLGDRYWHWGNYHEVRKKFPDGVTFRIDGGDWKRDWPLCQPVDLSPSGRVLGPSVRRIVFSGKPASEAGARLRLSICGSRAGSELEIILNGRKIGTTGPLPENGVMHRDSHRGVWFERFFPVAREHFHDGENVFELKLRGSSWHHGILYDYLALEELRSNP